jgi:hypothetical protein
MPPPPEYVMLRSNPIKASLLVAGLLALGACGGDKAADAEADAAKAEKPAAAKQKTVFDDQLKALDKAKAVEKQLKEDQEKRDKEMRDQGA